MASAAVADRKPHKVSGTTVVGSDVEWLTFAGAPRVSPDGEWIVWLQDAEVNDAFALWAVRRGGGTPKRLSGTLAPGQTFNEVYFSPDSKRVLYTAAQETSEKWELYTVPLLGTAASGVKVNPAFTDGDVVNVSFSPDGTRVLFRITSFAPSGDSLFSAPVDASSPAVGLDGPLLEGGITHTYEVGASRVVFARTAGAGLSREVWAVPFAGGARVRLTPAFLGTGDARDFHLSPDRTRVAFRSNDSPTQPEYELWSAAIAGAADSAVRIAETSAAGGDVFDYKFSPDGSRVVFHGDVQTDEKIELYSVPWNGSALPVKLNTGLIADGDVFPQFFLSPDGTNVVYSTDWAVDERQEVFRVPIVGPSAAGVIVSRTLVAGEAAVPLAAFDDIALFAIVDDAVTQIAEIRAATYAGAAHGDWQIMSAKTNLRLPGALLPDRTILTGDVVTLGEEEIWTVANDGKFDPESLFNPFWSDVVLGDKFALSPDESEFFYLAAHDAGPLHLWGNLADGSQFLPAVQSPTPIGSGSVIEEAPLEVTADGFGILFEADAEISGREELYISDSLIFAADFDEEGNTSEWSGP